MTGPLWDFYMDLYKERRIVLIIKDRVPIYRYSIVKQFRDINSIETFPHSAQLPDMNPIKHVWYLIKVAINKHLLKSRNEEELKKALLKK